MAGIRRAPRPPGKPVRAKPVVPLHQRILGKAAIEFDTVEDLRYKLELAYESDNMEWDTYNACHDALDIREANAKVGLDKATGRYVKPQKVVVIPVKVVRQSHPKPWPPWKVKVVIVLIVLFFIKIASMNP